MKRILLIGKDPVFAWALERTMGPVGYHVEHIFTLVEAKLRLNRFDYALILLDGLNKAELDPFLEAQETSATIFVFDGFRQQTTVTPSNLHKTFFVAKENALSSILASIKDPEIPPQTA